MFINSGRDASILEWGLRGKPIKDDAIPIGALDKFSDDLPAVREFVHLDVDGALHGFQVFASIVEVIPGRAIVDVSDQSSFLPGKVELSAVVGMFSGLENPGSFVLFWGAKLPSKNRRHRAKSQAE